MNKFNHHNRENESAVLERLLTIEDLAQVLQVEVSTLYSWVHTRKIRHIKVGKLLRFRASDITNFLKTNTVETYQGMP